MIINFITNVMLFAGVGIFLEKVFITDNEKGKISAYLENGGSNQSLTQRFSNFLEMAHSIVFGRFFSVKLFTWSFLFSAAIVSLVSFLLVISIQIYLFPVLFNDININATQVVLVVAFILFNVAFDYFTIIQTKVFIEASLGAKSIFRAIVFIASDLIVTMNTFILCYAFFILLVVQVFIATPKSATLVISDSQDTIEFDSKDELFLREFQDQEFTKRVMFRGDASGALFSEELSNKPEYASVYYWATFDLGPAELKASLLTNLTNFNLSWPKVSVIESGDVYAKFTEILSDVKTGVQSDISKGDQQTERLVRVDFDVDGSVFHNGSLQSSYTASFHLANQLEDGFPASIAGPLEPPSLSKLILNATTSPIIADPTVVCFEEGIPTTRFFLIEGNYERLNRCNDFAIVELFWSNALDKRFALVGRDVDGYRVPFNTLLITSMLPTAFFYLSTLLLAIASLFYSTVIKGTNRVKQFFLRAPLAISGAILGAVLTLVGLI